MPVKKKPMSKAARAVKRAGVSGVNKPKRTPKHPKKSHIVVAKVGETVKTIRFGEQGARTAGKPKSGESDRMKKKSELASRPDTGRTSPRANSQQPTGQTR